jgi:CheY-like chemotaxis protein
MSLTGSSRFDYESGWIYRAHINLKRAVNRQYTPRNQKLKENNYLTGTKVTVRQDVVNEAKKNYGYFFLLRNDVKDSIESLEIYRNKDLVEKAFGNLKERLNFSRTAVSSDQSLDGKLFVEFVAFKENRDKINLVILDIIMPKMNGKEAFDEMRKIDPDLKGIFVSGYTRDIIINKGLIDQSLNFLSKPVNPKELLNKVREVLEN